MLIRIGNIKLLLKGDSAVVNNLDVPNGKSESVALTLAEPISLWVNKETTELKQVFASTKDAVSAPLKKMK